MTNPKIRLLIADDHSILRQGLKRILEEEPDMDVVGEASTGKAAVELTHSLEPDVVILDVSMPDQNGIESMEQIASSSSKSRVLILSVHRERAVVGAAISAGASGYLPKDSLDTDLLGAIRIIHGGGSVFSADVTRILAQRDEERTPKLSLLTTRETEVFHLLAEGKTAREVADQLCISPKTVHTHRQHILDKLGFRNLAELIRYAVENELA